MKQVIISFIACIIFVGCQTRKYYSSKDIIVKNVYYNGKSTIIEFFPPMESIYYCSGITVDEKSQCDVTSITFVRQHREFKTIAVDFKTEFFGDDSIHRFRVEIPCKLNSVTITPPNLIYYSESQK